MEREVATTAYPSRRKPETSPAPMPWEPPVMIATLRSDVEEAGLPAISSDEFIRQGRPRRSRLQLGVRRRGAAPSSRIIWRSLGPHRVVGMLNERGVMDIRIHSYSGRAPKSPLSS